MSWSLLLVTNERSQKATLAPSSDVNQYHDIFLPQMAITILGARESVTEVLNTSSLLSPLFNPYDSEVIPYDTTTFELFFGNHSPCAISHLIV